jgi:hypothetical protein
MKSTNAQSRPPNSSETSELLDPIEFARTLTQQYSALSADVAAFGFRDRLYTILQGNFLLGAFYKEHPDAYRRFRNDAYWRDVRQKPNARNVMRSVLGLTLRMKGRGREALQNRVYKYARVLEYFHRDEVVSDAVPRRLKDGGGIDAIYAALCRNTRRVQKLGDGLEEPLAALPLARTGDGTTDTRAVMAQGQVAAGEIDGDGCRSDDDGRQRVVEGRRRSAPLLTATNDATDALSDDVQTAGGAKRGPLDRIDLKTVLAVEMFECQLEEVLHAKRVTIRAIIEPRDQRGWVTVRALSVLTSNSAEGPWPGQSTIKRDDDERP